MYKTYRDNQTINDNAGPVIGMCSVFVYVHVWSPTNQCNLKDNLFKAKLWIYQYIENERHSLLTNVDEFNNSTLQVLSSAIMNAYGLVCCVFIVSFTMYCLFGLTLFIFLHWQTFMFYILIWTISHLFTYTDMTLQIPVTWPLGTYGLIKTTHGCPQGKVTWYSGWREQDTENTRVNNIFSDHIDSYMAGTVVFLYQNWYIFK